VITLLYGTRPPFAVAATPEAERLWLSADALPAATGWELKPEGLCQDDRCVPVPAGVSLVRENQVDLTALAGLLGQAVLRDEAHAVWCFGEAAPARRAASQSLQAPDFTLPDLDGRPHALRDYRGKKVFLVSWASW
jgi:hypothetical protein